MEFFKQIVAHPVLGILVVAFGVVGIFARSFLEKVAVDAYEFIKRELRDKVFGRRFVPSQVRVVNSNPSPLERLPVNQGLETRRYPATSSFQIQEKLRTVTPYQKEETRRNYEGLFVDWAVQLVSLWNNDPETLRLFLHEVKDDAFLAPAIWVFVKVYEHPEFKTMEVDTKFRVQGKIKTVDTSNDIFLADTTFTF